MKIPGTIKAAEILRRSTQGVCKPFFVRDTQDDIYVVKGVNGTGQAALVSELLCAELGERAGLPIPDYALMEIPEPLIQASWLERPQDIGGGLAFASKLVATPRALSFAEINDVPLSLQQRVLVFDKWVFNGDRKLTQLGGNVNLLLSARGSLVVIDHNIAFDMTHSDSDVTDNHVFSAQVPAFDDMVVKAEHHAALDTALADWSTIVDLLPESWLYPDPYDDDIESQPTLEQRLELLLRIRDDSFWRMI